MTTGQPISFWGGVDPLLVSGPVICKHFYGETIPVVTLNNMEFQMLKTGWHAVVDGGKSEIILSGCR